MQAIDYVILAVVAVILAASAWFIYRSKKKGRKCIGCPDNCVCSSGNCSGSCSGNCSNK